ncbi:MAG: hypothetical protein ACK5M5_02345 [Limnobaculum xujianqingii]
MISIYKLAILAMFRNTESNLIVRVFFSEASMAGYRFLSTQKYR